MSTSTDNTAKPALSLVSICIPAYNAGRFIAETLESALAQDYCLGRLDASYELSLLDSQCGPHSGYSSLQ